MKLPTLLLGLALVYAAPASAQTSGDLLKQCHAALRMWSGPTSDVQTLLDGTHCAGYVDGTADGLGISVEGRQRIVCAPAGVTLEQLVRIVVKWLEERPEEHHEHRFGAVVTALSKAFPCPAVGSTGSV